MALSNVFEISEQNNHLSIDFSSNLENIDKACRQTMIFLRTKMPDSLEQYYFAINLVMREGLTNAVRHGNKQNPAKLVKFFISVENTSLVKMEIEDQGEGFNWQDIQVKDPGETEHGRGLLIIGQYFSKYWYNDKGNKLFLIKTLS